MDGVEEEEVVKEENDPPFPKGENMHVHVHNKEISPIREN